MREGWIYKKLKDIGVVVTGNTPSTKDKENYSSDDYCFVKPSDIAKDGVSIIKDSESYISEKGYNSSRKLPKGSVLTTCIGIIGKVGILEIDATCNQQINAIIPSRTIFPKYLALAILSVRSHLEAMANAPVVPIINKGVFSNVEIPVPSFEEQERIVAELDLLTGIIDKQKQQLKELDTLAQSIFYDMFGSPDANEKEWIMKSLAEIGTIVSGSTPSTSDESNWDGDVNWVTPAELGVQLFYGETRRKITSKAAKSLTIMPIGTLLMSSRAPIGKLAITSVPMCCNQGFKNIVCGNNVNNIYLYYCLMLNINSIKAMGRGATFKEVSKQAVSSFEIMLPPMNLQELFAQKILSIESQKKSINRSIAESQKLFDYTMDKYFG